MFSNLVHLIPSFNISYPYLIKFHDFMNNNREEMKHQMRGATQAKYGMTLWITLLSEQPLRVNAYYYVPFYVS